MEFFLVFVSSHFVSFRSSSVDNRSEKDVDNRAEGPRLYFLSSMSSPLPFTSRVSMRREDVSKEEGRIGWGSIWF